MSYHLICIIGETIPSVQLYRAIAVRNYVLFELSFQEVLRSSNVFPSGCSRNEDTKYRIRQMHEERSSHYLKDNSNDELKKELMERLMIVEGKDSSHEDRDYIKIIEQLFAR